MIRWKIWHKLSMAPKDGVIPNFPIPRRIERLPENYR